MKFLLDYGALKITGTVVDWHDLAPTRHNQPYRNDLADALRHASDRIYDRATDGGGSGRSGFASLSFRLKPVDRDQASSLARYLRVVADQIANNAQNDGAMWRLEREKSKSGEAA